MKRAFVLTAFNRPDYLERSLQALRKVRGLHHWTVVIAIEPSPVSAEINEIVSRFFDDMPGIVGEVVHNPQVYGVLHHPWVWFERLFGKGYDYVVRSEDDLVLTEDALEYHRWASEEYLLDAEIGMVTSTRFGYSGNHSTVTREEGLPTPLLIGTWRDRWQIVIGPTWDHDYSTNNGVPGVEAGWDWNLNTRVFPAMNLKTIVPTQAKVEHIGIHGAHSTPEVFRAQPVLATAVPEQMYVEIAR